MSDWEVTSKVRGNKSNIVSLLMTAGLSHIVGSEWIYCIKNKSTGEEKFVGADDEDDLGRKIADGDFE